MSPFPIVWSPARRLVVSSAFSPADVSGLTVWYDFSDISTLYQDSSKTTPVASDGDPIGAAVDKSENGNDALQATTANKPTYKTGIQNSLSVGRGDGNDLLSTTGSPDLSAGFTVFSVWKVTSFPSSAAGVVGANPNAMHLFVRNTGQVELQVYTDGSNYIGRRKASGYTTGNLVILRGNYDGGLLSSGVEIFSNGAQIDDADVTAGSFTGMNTNIIKQFELCAGDICETLVYTPELSTADQALVETYLNDKWAVY